MKDPRWVLNRLRTMSAGEVAHRAVRMLRQRLEQIRLAAGWSPGRHRELSQSRPLFGTGPVPREQIVECWGRRFDLDAPGLQALLAGQLPMFGDVMEIGVDPDWHRDPKTGRRAPTSYGMGIDYRQPQIVGDIKVLWEMSRHQHLVPLAVAYAVTGEERYRVAVAAQVDSWVAANPYGSGVHWASAMEVALRGIAWSMVHSLLALRDEGGLLEAAGDREALVRAIYQHGYFIEKNLSRFSSANNHLIGELVGLLCLGTVFDFGADSERWRRRSTEELEREILVQVWPDGVAKEQAVQYQLELLDYFAFAGCLTARAGYTLPPMTLQRMRAMVRFLRILDPGTGELPQIGDSDEGVVNRFDASAKSAPQEEVVAMVEYLLGGSGPRQAPSERAFWYRQIGPLGSGEDAVPDPTRDAASGAVAFPDGGYVVVREGPLHAVFDAGPLGFLSIAAHGHADALSFCAAWRGLWWLVDPGTFAYHGDPPHRRYFRGTSAHNTVAVDATDQSLQGGAFMWLSHAPAEIVGSGSSSDGSWAEGVHEGYRQLGVIHRRRLEASTAGDLRVVDSFALSSPKQRQLELNLHFHPDVELDLTETECLATRQECADVLRMTLDDHWSWRCFRGSSKPLAGWYSRGLGHKEPCWTLRGTREVSADTSVSMDFRFAASAAVSRQRDGDRGRGCGRERA